METKSEVKLLRFILNLTIAIILILIILSIKKQIDIGKIFDLTILTSFCVVFIIDFLADYLFYLYKNKSEDKRKLSSDYIALNKKYIDPKYEFQNTDNDTNPNKSLKKLLKKCKTTESKFTFPIIFECDLRNKDIIFEDSHTMYEVPDFITQNASQLMESHSTSEYFNNLNIRVKDWYKNENNFIIKTERTTYYKSLLTNRCMDYELQKNLTVREVLEYGPYLSPLNNSKLSNHLGFNAFVRTSDNWIPLIKRKNDLSDGKRTYGLSVQASIKTKYCLSVEPELKTQEQIYYCLKKEITDELGIPEKKIVNNEEYIYAAYRDIREGGKPQLFAFFNLTITKEDFIKYFKEKIKKKNKVNKRNVLIDGTSIKWIEANPYIDSQIALSPNLMVYNGKQFMMTPSSAACVAFALNFGLLK